ncbi:PTS sugar transporter subunit IIA [Luteimonas terricola]|uniref:PTS fructose transporter subunit IIA n=1 Tax=Luteimonas terricola TaxID=645597 RepID=A0ABQ2ELD9_9GAMM|nr:PTS sugar transporter subunit IIA [Luteimonas terricola]GGK12046.1 PTS fructose transporter subunit IIA [Luteimonas terricola]
MPYTDLLAAGRIVQMMEPGSRDQVLDAAARLLGGDSPGLTPAIADGLRRREAVGSTGIGRGVAIPHCRSDACGEPRAAFLRLAKPVDFDARDGEPVDLVFAMAVPGDHGQQQHLDTLSELAGRFADADFRESVRDAPDITALRNLLLQHGAPQRVRRA